MVFTPCMFLTLKSKI